MAGRIPPIALNLLYTTLQHIISDFGGLKPELALIGLCILLLVVDLLSPASSYKQLTWISALGILLVLGLDITQWYSFSPSYTPSYLYGTFIKIDTFSVYTKFILDGSGIITILFAYFSKDSQVKTKGEFYYLLVALLLGLHLLVMASNFLMLFLSLELISIASYCLTAFNFDKKSAEASLKYILFGALSTGCMLFGISLLYGLYGNFNFPTQWPIALIGDMGSILFLLGFLLALSGILFKTSLFPFHFWTPDVYDGAPMPIVAFFSIAPKAAAMVLFYKLLQPVLILSEVSEILTWIIASIACITMAIGNLSALAQTNTKRLLGYSSLGHAGFILMSLLTVPEFAGISLLFYLTISMFMNFTAFLLVDIFAKEVGSIDVNNFKGLGLKMPLLGVIFVITMVSLTGLPPTAGFSAKLFVFSALWKTYQNSNNLVYLSLLAFGLLNSVISLFFYLKIPYFIFFKKDQSNTILTSVPVASYIFIVVISLPLLVLFFNPNWILNVLVNIKL